MRFLLLLILPTLALAAEPVSFDRTVAPILAGRCLDCHTGADAKGGLDLSTAKGLAKGEAVVAGKPSESSLWKRIDSDEMPPKHPLPANERKVLKDWIEAGAKWGSDPIDPYRFGTEQRAGYDWWSLQPLVTPKPPESNVHPIDAFVRAKLAGKKLSPSPAADRRTLIRRVTFDLIGLPPTPTEIDRFVEDNSPEAYAKLVDRLLASPHFGERWARHWLDVARFSESDGFEYDRMRPNAWYYRDWVIQALNADMPYDRFAQLQIAGDVLAPNDADAIIATGFLVGGPHDSLLPTGDALRQIMRQDELEEIVGTVGQTFLGITVHCARCHDHKFDPVWQSDYYRMASALSGIRRGERPLPQTTTFGTDRSKPPPGSKVFAVTPKAPEPTYRLKRGNPAEKAELVSAGGLSAIAGNDFGLKPDAPEAERRKALAAWIASERNPLFARTMVNRVWLHHFGRGLVDTPNDLGFSGGAPSHRELLDWLAAEFVAKKWSLKELHRLIVLGDTYRQASAPRPEATTVDAENKLLWRYSPRRLEAEALRDATLAIAGQLDPAVGGQGYFDVRPFFHKGSQFYEKLDPVGPVFNRRSIYRRGARGGRNPLLDTFDCPDPSTTTPKRSSVTTPLQALSLMNNAFVLRMADHMAERLKKDAGEKVDDQIQLGFRLVYGRPAKEAEIAASREAVAKAGLASFCRALLNSNGFLYVH
jgi:hypothetical protein